MKQLSDQEDNADKIIEISNMTDKGLVDYLLPPRENEPVQNLFAKGILLNRLEAAERYKDIIINQGRR